MWRSWGSLMWGGWGCWHSIHDHAQPLALLPLTPERWIFSVPKTCKRHTWFQMNEAFGILTIVHNSNGNTFPCVSQLPGFCHGEGLPARTFWARCLLSAGYVSPRLCLFLSILHSLEGGYWWRIKSSPIDSILSKDMFQVLFILSPISWQEVLFLKPFLYIFSFSENFCQQQQYWPSMNMMRLSGGGDIFPHLLEQNSVCQCLGTHVIIGKREWLLPGFGGVWWGRRELGGFLPYPRGCPHGAFSQ